MADEEFVTTGPAFAPPHPGEVLREDILPAMSISKAKLAKHLGISRQSLYAILNEERSLTADNAARLARTFGNSIRFWLNLQTLYDAWHAERKPEISKIKKLDMAELSPASAY